MTDSVDVYRGRARRRCLDCGVEIEIAPTARGPTCGKTPSSVVRS
jgi:hypothetical protein